MSTHLSTPIKNLTRVGAITAKRLALLGITTVETLLSHIPFRFEDYSNRIALDALSHDARGSIQGTITSITAKKTARKRVSITEAFITDGRGTLKLIWFNQPFITQQLHEGDLVSIAGIITHEYNDWVMKSPQYEKIHANQSPIHTASLIPVYATTAGLTQKQIRFLMHQALDAVTECADIIPRDIQTRNTLITKQEAIKGIHAPTNKSEYESAHRRLQFEELFLLQLSATYARAQLRTIPAPHIPFNETQTKALVDQLPFTLTNGQKKAAWRIIQDMEQAKPMNRLVQGDVGSGKTIVAAIAALNAAMATFQSAFMAPTEILAYQHYHTIAPLFPHHSIGLLTRTHALLSTDANATKKSILEHINDGSCDIIIGTHALLQEHITFASLGLVVIDEQHRFGVAARKQLKSKTQSCNVPHFLSMTATPIPRTLALSVYGDLDITTIRELPKNRKPIITRVAMPNDRAGIYSAIQTEIARGKQVFVVCPLIEESDALGVASATAVQKELQQQFPTQVVGIVHGRLRAQEKKEAMQSFVEQRAHILVATSVIEVGVDVPNATIMIIEGAERFGLSQLHQIRGRVGRSSEQSFCYLFVDEENKTAHDRLNAFVKCADGFEIAELDLSLRGHGALYGNTQSGFETELSIADVSDIRLLEETKNSVTTLLETDTTLEQHPVLREYVEKQISSMHFE